MIICFVCAVILSVLSTMLSPSQKDAEKLYNYKKLLISARILTYSECFEVRQQNGEYVHAIYDEKTGLLVPSKQEIKAKDADIFSVYANRVKPRLVNSNGELFTFEEANIDEAEYMEKNAKLGFAKLPYKLIYVIEPNLPKDQINKETPVYGYVIPIAGYGLWDAIYGYLAIKADGDTVIGATWYNQKETPGLGGEIGTEKWQKQFYNKKIFQQNADGTTDYQRAVLGIKIVKTSVEQEFGNSPMARSAVDGISGATITETGVTEAYRQTLDPYRPFLIKAHQKAASNK